MPTGNEVVGYVRVSTREQAISGLSIAAQERRIEQYCEFKSLDLKKIIRDDGVSAATPLSEREGGAEVLRLTRESGWGVIAVKLDRLFRDAHDCLGVTKLWNTQGIALHLMDLGVDTNSAMGRAFLTNAATYAELEKNLISERTKEALNQLKIDGGDLGAPAYGWKYSEERDPKGRRRLEPIHDELRTVHECLTLRDLGFTYRQIADKFNAEGIPSKRGGKWHASAVRYCYLNAKKLRES